MPCVSKLLILDGYSVDVLRSYAPVVSARGQSNIESIAGSSKAARLETELSSGG